MSNVSLNIGGYKVRIKVQYDALAGGYNAYALMNSSWSSFGETKEEAISLLTNNLLVYVDEIKEKIENEKTIS